MNNNILLLAILVVLINFSFYLRMGKINRYLLLSGLAVISGAVLYSGVREGFQSNNGEMPTATDPDMPTATGNETAGNETAGNETAGNETTTGNETAGTGDIPNTPDPTVNSSGDVTTSGVQETQSSANNETKDENTTLMALEPEESKKLSLVAGKTQILSLLDTLEMKHLSDLNSVLRTVADNSTTMYSVQQDLGLIIEILKQLRMENSQRENTELSMSAEYSALRDNLLYVFLEYTEAEYTKMLDLFTVMFNVVPIENKGSMISSYLFEVNNRLLEKQKEAEMKRREQEYAQRQEETTPTEPARDPLVAEERLNAFLQDKTPEKFEELFGKVEPQDMVYNVGVPVEDYMKQIIRPQDWSRALRPPSCIRDSTQLIEPVAILDQGIPSNVHEFRGVGTILPKFAYTEVYDPKFY